ncbi:MAG: hypothetical protein AB9919_05910 [Geobacteraceae bacterium]
MKNLSTLVVAIVLLMKCSNVIAENNFSGEYVKKNGAVQVKIQNGNSALIWINTVVDMHPCNIGLYDEVIGVVNKNILTYSDTESACKIRIVFEKSSLVLATRNCDDYCGMHARGSMDGRYRKKSSKPDFPNF